MIVAAGISHHTAPLAVRERFAVSLEGLPAALAALRRQHGAAVLLSTCNRTELYLSAVGDELDAAVAARALVELADGDAPPEAIVALEGREAARHLLRVAAGLDSMVLGEDQILGQVRSAFIAAVEAHSTDHLLSRLFHLAIATGRRVRSETALGRHTRSVSAAAVQTLHSRIPDLSRATVLVLGAGEAGKLATRGLAGGIGRLIVANRTLERARSLADGSDAEAIPIEALPAVLAAVDAVVCASAAPSYQITPGLLRAARGPAATRPLLLIDIAVPRDVDPVCGAEPGVTLLDLDGLDREPGDGGSAADAVAAAEAIVDGEVAGLEAWWETLQVVPTISALRAHAEAIRSAELARTLARLPELTPRERARVEALSAAIVSKLLHRPISKLKQPGAGERYAALVHDLFDLPPGAGPGDVPV